MPVDPHLVGLLQLVEAAPPMHQGSPAEAREALRKLTVGTWPAEDVPQVAIDPITVPGPDGDLAARVYRPARDRPLPTVVFLHGGGWVVGDLDTHDNVARLIARDCEAVVVSVDYRLAPEHPFPAAADDAVAAVDWVGDHLDRFGGASLAVAGDSAGGNLAAVVAQHRRDAGLPLAGQLLVYPAVDVLGDYPSRTTNATGYFLDEATMTWFMAHYGSALGDDITAYADPRISPLHADLAGVAPAVLVTAEYDPLRDEGEAYAAALDRAGVPTRVRRFDGMIHGFLDMRSFSPGARGAIDETLAMFRSLLHG